MFYSFGQNNSGGSFDYNYESGITHWVIVEADSESDAIKKAEEIGLYFDGCDSGIDCPCCGDRWYYPDSGSENPEIYGKQVVSEIFSGRKWMPEGKECCIHHADGRKEWF